MKYKIIAFGILLLFAVSLASAHLDTGQYGMMGSDGQFYPTANYGGMGGMMGMMNMMGGYGYGGGMMLLGWITYLLVVTLIISAIYWLIKTANRKR